MTRFNTQLVHGLPVGDNATGAVNPPIYNSTTYAFEGVGSMPRYDYARSGNPTREFLERQIAQLEHGTRGFAFASGLAAIHATLSIFKPGDRIVVGKNIYGGTYSLFHEYFGERGLVFDSVDTHDFQALTAAVAGDPANDVPAAKAVYFEVLTNPLLDVNDVRGIANVAHRYGALAIVDNTFVTPYLQRPLDLGADIVIHSATKYLAGHSDVNAGLVVSLGEEVGNKLYFAQNRFGGVLAPLECDAVRRGIQTLALRMDRQQANAKAIAQYLLAHPLVKTVNYPGLPGREAELREKGLKGAGGVLSFEVVPGVDPADVLDNLHVFRLAVSLGAVESLAELPCRMTHFELPREERLKVGITDELVRLAVGIEDAADLIEDLGQAFDIAYSRYLERHAGADVFAQLASGVFA
ncbi:aminotransferase class I/II-fold pyridoxal phosphate-dependent enzyme [Bifidobacterium sp. CP2]|uniref:trans-sulfuration enzyme family protein n=1 Tax=Bifidobacterium TaxID=1678 RepID=UPI001BDD8722|nr:MULTISPECIES: aminotransferase class I/II-fold pyridoxal phosphate-dependent enzyme [Bifidobacterium]MBT1180604.1 aminotransferase class I/II-fold pyridoxal phosphate-dependent enzyme [Bifidobacterium sp. CP2]MBW3080449.1 aminotransferase class I/II-fold pyridoxal phosphate-dependent enzyme [Bifidobacterium saguinibicoloris]